MLSFIFHFSIVTYFAINPLPSHVHQNLVKRAQDDLARLIVPEPEIEEKAPVFQPLPIKPTQTTEAAQADKRSYTGTGTATQKGKPVASSGPQGSAGGIGEDQQPQSQPSEDVSSVGVLALLSTTGTSQRDDMVADILGEGAGSSQDLDQVFNNLDKLGREGKLAGTKRPGTKTGKRTRGARTITEENIDQLLSDLGTAKSTSLTRSSDLIALELSPLTHEGDEEGGAVLVGARDPEKVTAVINAHKAALQYCYQRELKRNPNLRGKIVVRFTITPQGTAKDVKILSSTIDSEHVERCVLSRIRRWDDFGQIDPALGDATFRQVYSFGY